MCTGCVQSGLEFAASGSVVVVVGLRHVGLRARDRLRPDTAAAADKRARREAQAAAFLESLDLDAGVLLAPDRPTPMPHAATQELQPA